MSQRQAQITKRPQFPLNVVSNLHINILETVDGDEDKAAVAAQILACTSLGSADGAKRLVQDLLGCTPEQATQVYVCTMLADTLKGLINLGALAGGARGGEKLNLSGEDDGAAGAPVVKFSATPLMVECRRNMNAALMADMLAA